MSRILQDNQFLSHSLPGVSAMIKYLLATGIRHMKSLSWECLFVKVGLSRFPGAKDCTKHFSRRGSDELFPGILETHITYFIWVQHILPSHSTSGWICYSLFSFFPISKYVQERTASEYSYQPSLKNGGK